LGLAVVTPDDLGACFRSRCARPPVWEIRQAGTSRGALTCPLHAGAALERVFDGAAAPRPVAAVFALVTPLPALEQR